MAEGTGFAPADLMPNKISRFSDDRDRLLCHPSVVDPCTAKQHLNSALSIISCPFWICSARAGSFHRYSRVAWHKNDMLPTLY